MKKFLTALIAFVMCFSVVTTAFAATPDEISESDVASEIRQVMIDTYYGGKEPEYLNIEIVGSTSDGGVYFMHNEGFSLDYSIEETIGDYTYHYNHNDDVMLYKNGNVYSIKEAYESGVIDDSILEELSKMNFGLESNKPNTTVPTEPTTSVATVDEPVTVYLYIRQSGMRSGKGKGSSWGKCKCDRNYRRRFFKRRRSLRRNGFCSRIRQQHDHCSK